MKALNFCLGARIEVLRRVAGLSRSQLAEATGCSPFQIRDYEKGAAEIGAAVVWQISKALDVPVQTLFPFAQLPSESRSFSPVADRCDLEPAPRPGRQLEGVCR
ncbi:helix-turn-helix domain-containing protein [Phenylobacterium sp.]|uniref:helix-turn-helix domain-containing protein n=1 Tax=Phenylobacterium sp. TaxID=1871053 RepID=UPI0039C8FB35